MLLTILMPCLNEAETLERCIAKAKRFIDDHRLDGEVLIADNGSTDGSRKIALSCGARIVHAEQRGYGAALIAGCEAAKGKYVIMGDADDSYDFANLMPFIEKLNQGFELVMGNRFAGGIENGAMPWSHRYIGNPILSFVGRLFFHSEIRDFHCGLRAYKRESIMRLNLQTTGMEYASEMVVKAELSGLRIAEVPTTLKKDGRNRPPHLRSFRDGWRHLKFLLMYAPNWLFLAPGLFLLVCGFLGSFALLGGQRHLGGVVLSIHSLLYFTSFIILGFNTTAMFLLVKLYAFNHDFLPKKGMDWNAKLKEDCFIWGGGGSCLVGLVLSIVAIFFWKAKGFSELLPEQVMRLTIPAVTMISVGFQSILYGFAMSIMKVKTRS